VSFLGRINLIKLKFVLSNSILLWKLNRLYLRARGYWGLPAFYLSSATLAGQSSLVSLLKVQNLNLPFFSNLTENSLKALATAPSCVFAQLLPYNYFLLLQLLTSFLQKQQDIIAPTAYAT